MIGWQERSPETLGTSEAPPLYNYFYHLRVGGAGPHAHNERLVLHVDYTGGILDITQVQYCVCVCVFSGFFTNMEMLPNRSKLPRCQSKIFAQFWILFFHFTEFPFYQGFSVSLPCFLFESSLVPHDRNVETENCNQKHSVTHAVHLGVGQWCRTDLGSTGKKFERVLTFLKAN